ncbi:hypothetical protein, partial [Sandarakinorhabdus sp.]|uniref:hypothetical protein n=1 Tax=Sandarakinorhabdus sp. TaxID=1916663 RepID=UPI003569B493
QFIPTRAALAGKIDEIPATSVHSGGKPRNGRVGTIGKDACRAIRAWSSGLDLAGRSSAFEAAIGKQIGSHGGHGAGANNPDDNKFA